MNAEGLAGVAIVDSEYPMRVSYDLASKIVAQTSMTTKDWSSANEDKADEPEYLTKLLTEYQDPKTADKIMLIQKNLDDLKDIMHKNINDVLKRGEDLESLMERSEDLSQASVVFYKRAKKTNQCCQLY